MAALTDELVKTFQPTTHFRDFTHNNDKRISSMAISRDGQTLISASNYHVLDVYDCNRGTLTNVIQLRKYGCGIVDFVDNGGENILVSSKNRDHTIRPLNIETKSYGTYYVGHSDLVTSLCVHRSSGLFLSAGEDKTIRLWDTRSPRSVSAAAFDGTPLCAWHPSGVLFGVGVDSQQIQMFDLRGLDNGPFCSFDSNKDFNCNWSNLKFSHDGKQILVSTNGTKIRVIDSIYGKVVHAFLSQQNSIGIPLEATFSPNGEYIFCGSSGGSLHVWNNKTATKVVVLDSNYPEAITCTLFNPKYLLLATGSSNVSFWTLPA